VTAPRVVPTLDEIEDSEASLGLGGEPGEIEGGAMKWDAATRVLEVTATARKVVIRKAR
jgi:hypothetical protein